MKICTACVLPETYPGIRFNADGVCNHCTSYEARRDSLASEKRRYRDKFVSLIEAARKGGERSYDAIMAYSGGKDSSYTLMLLRRTYGLRVIAMTFDNGFVSPQAFTNMRTITQALQVDHLVLTPGGPVLKKAFRQSLDTDVYPMKALERASAICNTCMGLVKSVVLRTAVEMGIPFIAYGWSPGQAPIASSVMRINEPMVRQMQKALIRTTGSIMGDAIAPYVLHERHYRELLSSGPGGEGGSLYAVHPLAFSEYREEMITREIGSLGWQPPSDTDSNSTNCLLNAYANTVHVARYGFHPYAFEIAGMVRDGCMTREEGIAKLQASPPQGSIDAVRAVLEAC